MKSNVHIILLFLAYLSLGVSTLNAAPTRIMPLGDSITYDSRYGDTRPISIRTAYRNHLWYALQEVKYDANFVGSKSAGEGIIPVFDTNNEGHSGWTSYEIAERTFEYMTSSQPDIVLLHIGTNDHSTSTRGVESILNEIDQYERNTNRRVHVLIALIIDRQAHDPVISVFNNKLSKLISYRRQAGDIITSVNMSKDSNLTASDYADNTHPNDSGYKKMANVWFSAIQTPYKTFNTSLSTFPSSIVANVNIISISIDESSDSVTFTTEIPDTGIKF